jgi:hypothetical protein
LPDVDADTFGSTARWVRNASTSGAAIAAGCFFPWKRIKALDPIEVRMLGADATMLQTKLLSDLIE